MIKILILSEYLMYNMTMLLVLNCLHIPIYHINKLNIEGDKN